MVEIAVERHIEHQRMLGIERRSLLRAAGGGMAKGTRAQWRVVSGRGWGSQLHQALPPNQWPGPPSIPNDRPQEVVHDSNPETSRPQPQSLRERLVFKQCSHFWAAELAQDLLELLSVGNGWLGEVGELGLSCVSLNSSA